MTDRFFASYEDEFSSRPNSGRDRSSVLPKSLDANDMRSAGRSAPHRAQPEWSEPDWQDPHFQADPYDRYGRDDFAQDDARPSQPMFAPLDRRAAQNAGGSVQSYPSQSFEDTAYRQPRESRPSYDQMHAAAYDTRAYDAPPRDRDLAPTYPAYGQRERGFQPDRMVKITQWAGTVCSVLVLLGAVYWAYELAVRDARGIPVVRAAEGPLRIAPTTPGGEISANQGLAVNSIAAKGGSETLPDVVTLAPAPLQLAQEDVAQTTSAEAPAAMDATPEPSPVVAETVPEAAGSALADLAAKTPDVMPISDEAAVEAALAMALSDGNEPATMSNTDAAQPAELADIAPDTTVTAPPTSEVDPASIPAGTKLVQLGAFDDDAAARAAWAVLQTQFTDLMGGKSLVVQQAKSGGRLFYRLRAHGFADEDETRRFCAALLAENASCIPVSQR